LAWVVARRATRELWRREVCQTRCLPDTTSSEIRSRTLRLAPTFLVVVKLCNVRYASSRRQDTAPEDLEREAAAYLSRLEPVYRRLPPREVSQAWSIFCFCRTCTTARPCAVTWGEGRGGNCARVADAQHAGLHKRRLC